MQRHCHRPYSRLFAPLGFAAPLLLLQLDRARAQDIGASALAYMETLAWRDSLKNWDQIKSYGAERIIDRIRPEYQPLGVRLPAGHLLFPTVGLKTIWDDNLFLDQGANKRGTLRTEVEARAKMLSQLPRHMFNVDISGRFTGFKDYDDLSYTDGRIFAEARIDIDAGNVIGGTAQRSLQHEDRFAAEAPRAAAEAVPMLTDRVELAYLHDQGRLTTLIGMDARQEDYTDVRAYDGSTLDQDGRDNTLIGGFARVGYRFSPGYQTFLAARINRQEFKESFSAAQNSTGYRSEIGVHLEANPLLRFQFAGGYDFIDVDNSELADTGALSWRAEMQWLPTERMTITVENKRVLEQSTAGGTYGLLSTTYSGILQYDIYHDLEMKLELTRFDQEFLGTDRLDGTWIAGAQLDYWVNRNAKLTLGYEYRTRDSTDAALDYEDNRFLAGVKVSF